MSERIQSPSSRKSPSRSTRSQSASPSRSPSRERNLSPRRAPNRANSGSPSDRSGSPSSRGRSRSPLKFDEKDFERKRDVVDPDKRRRALAKARGLKVDPSEFSRAELIEQAKKLGRVKIDRKTASGEVFIDSRRLVTDEILLLCELFKRVTEIQNITLNNCGITDDVFALLLPALAEVRHIKLLHLDKNLLTSVSADALIQTFASHSISRRFEDLSIKKNSLFYSDGVKIYREFNMAKHLFRIPIYETLTNLPIKLSLSNLEMNIVEVGIMAAMIKFYGRTVITHLDLSDNNLNAKAGCYVMNAVRKITTLRFLDLSRNPLTDEGTDFSAIINIRNQVTGSDQLQHVILEGVFISTSEEISRYQETISRALMVNRSVAAARNDPNHFDNFISGIIQSRDRPDASFTPLEDQNIDLDKLDEEFLRRNKMKICSVDVSPARIKLKWTSDYEVK